MTVYEENFMQNRNSVIEVERRISFSLNKVHKPIVAENWVR